MPLFFLIFGIVLMDSGLHGTANATYQQVKTDVGGFLAFGTAIVILGAIGYIDSMRSLSKGLLLLVFIVFILRNSNKLTANLTGAATVTSVDPQSPVAVTPALPADTTQNSKSLPGVSDSSNNINPQNIDTALNIAAIFA